MTRKQNYEFQRKKITMAADEETNKSLKQTPLRRGRMRKFFKQEVRNYIPLKGNIERNLEKKINIGYCSGLPKNSSHFQYN